jgi:hypothetical protein
MPDGYPTISKIKRQKNKDVDIPGGIVYTPAIELR